MLYFKYPWGLLALLSLGVVTFLYFFVFRGKRIEVSSLHLWTMAQSLRMEGKKKHRPPLTLPFILELLCALILSLLVAGSALKQPETFRHLAVVLDGSASMNGGSENQTFLEGARQKVDELFDELGQRGRITLVESGFEPRLLAREAMTREEALAALAAWRPAGPTHPVAPAVELALALGGEEERPILITDHDRTLEGVSVIAVGAPLENTGWVSSHWLGQDQLFALVKHFGGGTPRKTVTFFGDGQRIGESEVDFSKKASHPLTVAVPAGVSRVQLVLPDDALKNDNVLRAARPRHLTLTVKSDVKDPRFRDYIARAVESTERAVLGDALRPAIRFCEGDDGGPADLLVQIRSSEEIKSFAGPFQANAFHPLTRGIALEGAIWAADPGFEREGAMVLLAAGEVPLAVLEGNALVLNLDPSRSTLFNLPAWPVLMANLVEYVYDRSPGLKRFSYRLGERFAFTRPPGWPEEVVVEGPEGERVAFSEREIYYGRLEREGIYRILSGGEEQGALDVNLFSEEESDLTKAASRERSGPLAPTERQVKKGRLLHQESALLLLLMLFGCWFLLGRIKV